jgi:hypothetical protein
MAEPQQFLIYQSEDGTTRIDVMLEAETLRLNQKQLPTKTPVKKDVWAFA